MKKLLIFLFCITVFIILPACSNKTTEDNATTVDQTDALTEDDANDIGSLPLVFDPFFFTNDGITIVEFGEKCEWIEGFAYPDGKSCYTVNYIKAFGFTFKWFDWKYTKEDNAMPEIKHVSDLKNNLHRLWYREEGFKYIKNGSDLMNIYDDIIMLSDYQAKNVAPGDRYIIATKLTVFDRWEDEEYIIYNGYRDVTKGYMYPVVDDCLYISDMFDEQYVRNTDAKNDLLDDLLEANELIHEIDPDFPVFKNGTSISKLGRYFEYGAEIFYENLQKEIHSGGY